MSKRPLWTQSDAENCTNHMPRIISIENLSKEYRLGQIGTGTLTNDLKVWWAKARGKPNPLLIIGQQDHGDRDGEVLWALKDVSFEVEQGEVLGIIGRNGAGKSTLLKILSRVTAPTSGEIKVKGRIASLLEVGTGFHPDLTGRENIYLNGAILGMTKDEVRRKFDEIVAFAEIEKFIDTPVKRYSSGMYVRLAFAVAAHLDPEILVVDEVLAVGDVAFQQKCLGKMSDVAKEGRTVLFVSHNMAAVQNLCNRGIVLDKGSVLFDDEIRIAIETYLKRLETNQAELPLGIRTDRNGNGFGRFINFFFRLEGNDIRAVPMGSTVIVEAEYEVERGLNRPVYGVFFKDINGQTILRAYSPESTNYVPIPAGKGKFSCTFYNLPLMFGEYSISLYLGIPGEPIDFIDNVTRITIEPDNVYNTGVLPGRTNGGLCYTKHSWEFRNGPQ
jgi:lipopolysaccharide transport system ATP-binding protein